MFKIVATWVLALMVCVFVVKFTKVGPVFFVISAEYGHGVHVGDALVLIPLGLAFILTLRLRKNLQGN